MSNETCPTVKIKSDNEQGFVIINESDLTPDHELYVAPEEAEAKAAEESAAAAKAAEEAEAKSKADAEAKAAEESGKKGKGKAATE